MRKAFTLIELCIVLAVIAIVASLVFGAFHNPLKAGVSVVIKSSSQRGTILASDPRTNPTTYIVRIDNGPEARVRYTEARFVREELEVTIGVEK